jgi:polysaccharide biosynthesis transport protein
MTETMSGEPRPQPLVDLLPLIRILWQRRLLIAGCVVAALGVAALYLAVTRPMYSAQAVVLVDPRKPQTTDTDNVLPGIGSDSAAIASQVAVISSRELLMAVFDREGLAADPEFSRPDFLGGLMGVWPNRAMIFDKFAENVWVEREGLTYVINIGFKSHDPDKAARIVNAIVGQYIAGQVAEKAAANADISALLGDRIAELQRDVIEAERAVEAFRAAHAIYSSGNGATQLQAQIDELEKQLASAQEAARQAETRAQQAIAAGSSPQALLNLTQVLDSPTAEALRSEYNQRSLELSSQQAVLGPLHPTLRRLQSEMQRIEGLMVKEVARITEELTSARDIANGVVAAIESDLSALRVQGNENNLQQVELRQLERNADASRQVLEQFQKRAAETSQFENVQFSDARVITNATAPLRPVWPKGALIIIVAAVLGLIAGCATALLAGPRTSVAEPAAMQPAAIGKPRPQRPPLLPLLLAHFAPRRRTAKPARPTRNAYSGTGRVPAKTRPRAHANGATLPTAPTQSNAPVNGAAPATATGTKDRALASGKPQAANGEAGSANARAVSSGTIAAPKPPAAAVEAAVAEVRRRRGFAELN